MVFLAIEGGSGDDRMFSKMEIFHLANSEGIVVVGVGVTAAVVLMHLTTDSKHQPSPHS